MKTRFKSILFVGLIFMSSFLMAQKDSSKTKSSWEEEYSERISKIPPLTFKKKDLKTMVDFYIIRYIEEDSIKLKDKVKYHFDFPSGDKKFVYYDSNGKITGYIKFEVLDGKSYLMYFKCYLTSFLVYSDHFEYQVTNIEVKDKLNKNWENLAIFKARMKE